MSVSRTELVSYLNDFLQVDACKDYCPNGLQVEGRERVKKIISGVTATQNLIDAAVSEDADLVLVHHGFFWKGESSTITGMSRQRLKTLLTNDINLVGFHLPLDTHSEVGNNVRLADVLEIKVTGSLNDENLGLVGQLTKPMTSYELVSHIDKKLGRQPMFIAGRPDDSIIKTIAWCTGAAQDFIFDAIDKNVDAYLTGEVSERTTHIAREYGIDFIAAGHHATERYGIQALGEHLADKFCVEHTFIDDDNPV